MNVQIAIKVAKAFNENGLRATLSKKYAAIGFDNEDFVNSLVELCSICFTKGAEAAEEAILEQIPDQLLVRRLRGDH